jgi:hypothetical protein
MTTITKTIMHSGVEIRRSDELTASDAYLHRHPMQWVVDTHVTKWGFKTLALAQQFIDDTIKAEATKTYGDFSGNYWIVRPVDGKFTEIAITREECNTLRAQRTAQ